MEEDRNSFEVEVGKEKFELLKTAVLFGGNASGKSNFTSVLSIFRYYLFNKGIEKYNKETDAAIEEGRKIAKDPNAKGYHTMDELKKALEL